MLGIICLSYETFSGPSVFIRLVGRDTTIAQVLRHGQYRTSAKRVFILGLLFAVLPRALVVISIPSVPTLYRGGVYLSPSPRYFFFYECLMDVII